MRRRFAALAGGRPFFIPYATRTYKIPHNFKINLKNKIRQVLIFFAHMRYNQRRYRLYKKEQKCPEL